MLRVRSSEGGAESQLTAIINRADYEIMFFIANPLQCFLKYTKVSIEYILPEELVLCNISSEFDR